MTGELSNNGEPMRRFMQTFVLAPQSAKKFYVHNDIFRYQDEVYQDNSDSESEEHQQETASVKSSSANYYQPANDQVGDGDGDLNHHHLSNNSAAADHQVADQQPAKDVAEVKAETLLNGHAPTSAVEAASQPAAPQPQRVSAPSKDENKSTVVDLYTIEDVATAKTAAPAKEESTKQDSQGKGKHPLWSQLGQLQVPRRVSFRRQELVGKDHF